MIARYETVFFFLSRTCLNLSRAPGIVCFGLCTSRTIFCLIVLLSTYYSLLVCSFLYPSACRYSLVSVSISLGSFFCLCLCHYLFSSVISILSLSFFHLLVNAERLLLVVSTCYVAHGSLHFRSLHLLTCYVARGSLHFGSLHLLTCYVAHGSLHIRSLHLLTCYVAYGSLIYRVASRLTPSRETFASPLEPFLALIKTCH